MQTDSNKPDQTRLSDKTHKQIETLFNFRLTVLQARDQLSKRN